STRSRRRPARRARRKDTEDPFRNGKEKTMSRQKKSWISGGAALACVVLLAVAGRCAPSAPKAGARRAPAGASDLAVAAQKTYVPRGDLDEFSLFASGGHSGNVYVYGIPSMRPLSTIPVYTPYPATGYGFDDDSKAMLGNLTWGDVH